MLSIFDHARKSLIFDMARKQHRALIIVAKQRIEKQKSQLKMPKLKPSSIGLTLGVFLAILYTIRTIIIWLFPNFVVNLAKKITYNMISIQPAIITADA